MGNCFNSQNCVSQSKTTKMTLSSIPSSLPSTSNANALATVRTECEILSAPILKAFSFKDLKTATKNFRSDNIIGKGRVGYVYKGWLDEQTFRPKPGVGVMVAIKKTKPIGLQDYNEWLKEVEYLGKLNHPNLVTLIGYCSEKEYPHLVYKFMPKGSFENHLFRSGAPPLSWQLRLKVVIGAAKGLSFLHDREPQVLYRNFKGSNILLDSDYNAKLSDFGLAKAEPIGHAIHFDSPTGHSEAPEYVMAGPSAKADVYKFGVVLLELLTGRPAFDPTRVEIERDLVTWTKTCIGDEQKLYKIMDPRLEGQYPRKGAQAVLNLALHCVSDDPRSRPEMSEVHEKLSMI